MNLQLDREHPARPKYGDDVEIDLVEHAEGAAWSMVERWNDREPRVLHARRTPTRLINQWITVETSSRRVDNTVSRGPRHHSETLYVFVENEDRFHVWRPGFTKETNEFGETAYTDRDLDGVKSKCLEYVRGPHESRTQIRYRIRRKVCQHGRVWAFKSVVTYTPDGSKHDGEVFRLRPE